ncbi:L-threonylcarbamoyladenylate synthase [soil metagenome]
MLPPVARLTRGVAATQVTGEGNSHSNGRASATVPRIFDVSRNEAEAIAAAASALVRGDLVAMPTETVYGLAADAGNAAAVGRIFLAKGRPRFNPLIVHVPSLPRAEEIAEFSEVARALAEAFWPGPLTLVLPRRKDAPVADLTTAGLDTIAIRVPAHPVALALLEASGRPIAAPSANRSGHVSPTTAAHVVEDLGEAVSVILDAGAAPIGLESTIVGLASGEPLLLRAGGLARSKIEAVLGRKLGVAVTDQAAPVAPGMLASHYAPSAELRLDVREVRAGEALLAFGREALPGAERAVATINLSPSGDTSEAAAKFFAGLRDLDRRAKVIAVAPIPDRGLGEAINDRLRRAAAPLF